MTMLQHAGRREHSYGERLSRNLSGWMPDSDRLMRAARERPEALLVIAAGLALLMRGGGRRRERGMRMGEGMGVRGVRHNVNEDATGSWTSSGEGVADSMREGAESMTRYASDMASRVSETATEYTDVAARWAGDARETIAAQARALPGELDEAVRDHPLVLAALGVAVGAALGASLPASDIENRTFGSARDQLGEAAQGMSGRFTEAAEDALDAAKRGAERRGLSGETMRDVAREAAGAFASTAAGSEERGSGQRQNPQGSGSGTGGSGAGGSGGGQGGRRNL